MSGTFAHAIDIVDIAAGWTEQWAVCGKGDDPTLTALFDNFVGYLPEKATKTQSVLVITEILPNYFMSFQVNVQGHRYCYRYYRANLEQTKGRGHWMIPSIKRMVGRHWNHPCKGDAR